MLSVRNIAIEIILNWTLATYFLSSSSCGYIPAGSEVVLMGGSLVMAFHFILMVTDCLDSGYFQLQVLCRCYHPLVANVSLPLC